MFPQALVEHYQRARALFEKGRIEQSLALLDEIERQAPNHPEITHARAICLHALNRDDEALPLCNKMFTMHGDRRGLELRTRWKAQSHRPAQDHFAEAVNAYAPAAGVHINRKYLVTGLLVLVLLTFLMLVVQSRISRIDTAVPRVPEATVLMKKGLAHPAQGSSVSPVRRTQEEDETFAEVEEVSTSGDSSGGEDAGPAAPPEGT